MKIIEASIVNVKCGDDVSVIKPVNIYDCELGSKVFVGPFVEIQSGVKIGARTRIQSHTFICSLVEIGSDCFVGHGVMFINDKFTKGKPARGDQTLWQRTKIGCNVSIGSNATILPVRICSDVVIGAGAVVVSDISSSGTYAGNPAKRVTK